MIKVFNILKEDMNQIVLKESQKNCNKIINKLKYKMKNFIQSLIILNKIQRKYIQKMKV